MATPSYTTDLTDYTTLDTGVIGAKEFSGWIASGKSDLADGDNPLQGVGHMSIEQRSAGKGSAATDPSDTTDPAGFTESTGGVTGDCWFVWGQFLQAGAVEVFDTALPVDAGIVMMVGSGTGNFNYWPVGGKNFGRAPYGGWQNWVVDPTDPTSTGTAVGNPTTGVYTAIGFGCNVLQAINKGSPYNMDAIRWGRGELIVTGGDITDGYGNFQELSNANDANDISFVGDLASGDATVTNIADTSKLYPGAPISGIGIPGSTTIKSITNSTTIEMSATASTTNAAEPITSQPYNVWGLLQGQIGTFLWKGLISLGTTGTLVDFQDANRIISISDNRNIGDDFNRIEINNASSNVEWTSINIFSVGPQAKGEFEVIDAATVSLDTCIFTDMSTFVFNGVNNTSTSTTFRRCDQVTQALAIFSECTFDESVAASSLLSDNPADITNCTFNSDGSNHAIEATTAGSYNFVGHTFNNYATVNGSTGNEVFYNNSGGAITLNASGITGAVSVRNGAGASTSVVSTVVFTITNIVDFSEVRLIKVSDGTELAGIETVSTTSSGINGMSTPIADPNNAGRF